MFQAGKNRSPFRRRNLCHLDRVRRKGLLCVIQSYGVQKDQTVPVLLRIELNRLQKFNSISEDIIKQVKKYTVKVFNTFTSQYEEVEVSKEVYDEYRRGLWRIKKNNKRYCKHTTSFSRLKGLIEESENFHELIDAGSDPIDVISFEMVLDSLDETERDMVEAIVF